MIVGLFPELSAAGGVQRASRLTAAVLASFAVRRGHRCSLLSLNDPLDSSRIRFGSEEIAFTGFGRSKAGFFASALGAAFRQPKLIVALHPHLAPVVAAMKVCAPRARAVVFTHGIEVWAPLGLPRRWALRWSDLVLAPSTDTQRRVVAQQGVAESKVQRLRWSLGPEFDPTAPPCATSRPPEGFPRGRVVLTVGRWDAREAYKGLDHLIMTLPALLSAVPDLHLVAIGEGSDLPRLERLALQSGVSGHIHFLRQMQPEELSAAYGACELFALPSRGEGFGLVFLEAMSHGKPVIGGAHGGTPEIIEEGVTGYLVQHGDVTQLTERLLHLMSDESCRRQMGEKAFARARSDFTYPRFSEELTGLLDCVLASRAIGE
jgi:phosphatidyl-myo-inositol dimannoside synthase